MSLSNSCSNERVPNSSNEREYRHDVNIKRIIGKEAAAAETTKQVKSCCFLSLAIICCSLVTYKLS